MLESDDKSKFILLLSQLELYQQSGLNEWKAYKKWLVLISIINDAANLFCGCVQQILPIETKKIDSLE